MRKIFKKFPSQTLIEGNKKFLSVQCCDLSDGILTIYRSTQNFILDRKIHANKKLFSIWQISKNFNSLEFVITIFTNFPVRKFELNFRNTITKRMSCERVKKKEWDDPNILLKFSACSTYSSFRFQLENLDIKNREKFLCWKKRLIKFSSSLRAV
jgi:hypothetical protein